MSLESWKKEFYPTESARVPKKKSLDHMLRLWEGLKRSSLKRHGVEIWDGHVVEKFFDSLELDESSALCEHFYSIVTRCEGCPVTKALNGEPCWDGKDNPYDQSMEGNALPMLRLLRKAKKLEEQKLEEQKSRTKKGTATSRG